MILGIGIDLVEVDRFARMMERHGDRMRKRLFTDGEWDYCHGHRYPERHLAARFAAKEAASKAFGTGIAQGVRFTDFEICNDGAGAPHLRLHGKAAEMFVERNGTGTHVSLTHTDNNAAASVVLEGGGNG